MNWEAIGALGEVAGAIGVLITLIYLAYQIRLNTKLLQYSVQENASQNIRNQFHLFQDGFTRKSVLKAFHTDEDLTLEESAAAEAFLMGALAGFQSQYFSYKSGIISEKEWLKVCESIAFYFTTPWPRAWWEVCYETNDQEFAEIVGMIINRTAVSGTHLSTVLDRTKEIRARGA